MSPSVHRRSPTRRYSSSPSSSPVRSRPLLHRRSSPRRERSPPRRRSSPRARSPIKASSSHRARSPIKETLRGHAKSPDRARLRSPISRSPSPRIKHQRLEHEEHAADRERRRNNNRDGDKGRHNEKGLHKEVPNERRRGTSDDKSSKLRHGRSRSPKEQSHNHRSKYGSSPRATKGGSHDEATNSRGAEQLQDMDEDSVARMKAAEEALEVKQKQKPSFELSGKLAEETNRVRGVTLLFNEPPDARKPNIRWRLYVFKAGEVLNEPLYVHRQSCYLFGRERRVADVPTDHPSCSKQHAVIQFRLVEKEQPDGTLSKQVRPYLMDLGSTNGTFLNDNRIEPQRYYELMEKDTIKFGNSSREYVILHENSAG